MLRLYEIEVDYIKELNKADGRVQYNPKANYNNKPYVGILFDYGNNKYLVPLSSPKKKHEKMRNQADFHKIDNGKLGVLNINNMIPVDDSLDLIVEKDIDTLLNSKDPKDVRYGNLLNKQVKHINFEKERIEKKSLNLYKKYINGTLAEPVKKRCNNFLLLEQTRDSYLNKNKE